MNPKPTFEMGSLGSITVDLRLNEVHFHHSNTIEPMRQNEDGDWIFSHPGWEGEYRLQCLGADEWMLQHKQWINVALNSAPPVISATVAADAGSNYGFAESADSL